MTRLILSYDHYRKKLGARLTELTVAVSACACMSPENGNQPIEGMHVDA